MDSEPCQHTLHMVYVCTDISIVPGDGTKLFPWAAITTQYADGTLNGIAAGTSVNADPTAMTIVSALALIVNIIAIVYIIWKSVKTKTNPYKGEIFKDFKYYKEAADRAEIR